MRLKIPALGVLLATATIGFQAHASVVPFWLYGDGFSANLSLTITPDVSPADPNPLCGQAGQNPCRADPPGAYAITAVTGTFTDTNDGIVDANVTGLVPINPANERDPTFDPLVPTSLSFIDYAGGYLTYNNLYFPTGSPIDCAFPFSGTLLDVFGVAFDVAGGYTAVVWGDGDYGFGPLTYGVGVLGPGVGVLGDEALTYDFSGLSAGVSVPEPSTWLLMLMAIGGLGAGLRRARRRLSPA